MKKMRKIFHQYSWVMLVFVWFLVGCSSFREVSVVSHAVEGSPEPTPSASTPLPSVGPPSSSLAKVEPPVPAVSASEKPPVVRSPVRDEPPVKPKMDSVILAQSADESTLPWILEDIFFDYDQMSIRRDAIPLLEQNAKVLLKRYPNQDVLIQGHCDERGTEEYNLILGERRAKAVKEYLVDMGIPSANLRVLSLGKNQPFCLQHTHGCLQQNRRAHFVLK